MFSISENPIETSILMSYQDVGTSGALVSFQGMVRQDQHLNAHVQSLLYIADCAACQNEGDQIINEALEQFAINKAVCVQRIGRVPAGEPAVWIGVWAQHRDDAFKACRYIIEEIKKRLLIWKKEFLSDGTSRWIYGPQTPLLQ